MVIISSSICCICVIVILLKTIVKISGFFVKTQKHEQKILWDENLRIATYIYVSAELNYDRSDDKKENSSPLTEKEFIKA